MRKATAHAPATSAAFWQAQVLEGDRSLFFDGKLYQPLADEMQPLGYPVALSSTFFRC
jgi:hypothetical protein